MKKWTKELTKAFLSEADELIAQVKAFKEKWKLISQSHRPPMGKNIDEITDKEADLCDCLDDFMAKDE